MTKKAGTFRVPDKISNRDIVTAPPEHRQTLEEAQLAQLENSIRAQEQAAIAEEKERAKIKEAVKAMASTDTGIIVLRAFMHACGFNSNAVMFYRDSSKVADDRMMGAAWQRDIWHEFRKILDPKHRVLVENEDILSLTVKDN